MNNKDRPIFRDRMKYDAKEKFHSRDMGKQTKQWMTNDDKATNRHHKY
jgi:hypothetical protein